MSRQQEPRSERTSSPGRTVDARQLWSGGAATAVVAALIALAGILVCRWLFGIPVLAPRQDGAWGDASTAGYAVAAAAAVLRLDHRTGDRDRGRVPVQHHGPAVPEGGHRGHQPGARRGHRVADQRDRRAGDPAASDRIAAARLIAGGRERDSRGRTLAGTARRATVRTMRGRRG